jgi:hypothetical protein
MQKFLIVSVFSLALGLCANGGTIIISSSDNVVLTVPPVPGSLSGIGFACVGSSMICNDGVGAASISIPGAQASASGPADLTQPLTLSANGRVSGPGAEESGYNFTVTPSSTVTSEYLFPSISLNFAPDGLLGNASILAYQDTEGSNLDEVLELQVYFSGDANGSFTFDPSSNLMSLFAPVGDDGEIFLSSPGEAPGPVIAFLFHNGRVIQSNNNLGLALPSVSSAANFSVIVDPFQFSFPGLSSNQIVDSLVQSASLTAPEPGTAWLMLVGIATFAAKIRLRS